ncbi:MAG: hypothetical protein QGH70_04835 [Nitrospinota bacterium]|jgi:hypothetical protein|nr:hypothetical protein [Nitrospinota bacterium]MDP6483160.1 hypothetical protein [Nitrospinota bacterium]MDP6620018.1 hypothetical protein [Nitrospinota bacterium]HJM41939.1 hypothetical protein [Nitrospinota bacterium]
MGRKQGKRPKTGHIVWGLLTLLSVALIGSGIGPIELLGDALLALCLIKAGLKAHGHVIGGRRRGRGGTRRPRFGSKGAASPTRPPGNLDSA